MKYLYLLIIILLLGCVHCDQPGDKAPNIRTYPGEADCPAMCQKFKDLNCIGYFEDIKQKNGTIMTCSDFCIYELNHSVNLNPTCLVQNLKACNQIETICK